MFRKLFSRSEIIYPEFRYLSTESMLPQLRNGLHSKIYYTPKIQKVRFQNDELVKYLAFLTRKNTVKIKDMKQMTQNILTEYGHSYLKAGLEGENFGFQRNYHIKQFNDCPYHGKVDYMVHLNKTHFFPLMFFQNELNPYCGAGMAMANMQMKAELRAQPKTSGYSLITNGQEWILYKIYRNLQLQKSIIYQAKNNKFKNLYQDLQMVSVVLGLIDNCMDIQRPDVETLKIAYDFIDEQRFQIQAKQGEQIKTSIVSKWLTKHYQKKKDWNSK